MSDSDPLTRLNAALEGRYRIESELGEGGMATLYLADDLRHDRKAFWKCCDDWCPTDTWLTAALSEFGQLDLHVADLIAQVAKEDGS